MSEKQMEDLRRICLICGCHTSQIINVFEPRNGPNIVDLIRAKFKFQPVNDDKYLCYSCNNWLINWHSLKNLNKDAIETQPDKSRSRINNESLSNGTDHISHSFCAHSSRRYDEAEAKSSNSSMHRNKKRNGSYFPKRPLLNSFRIGKTGKHLRNCSICGRSMRKEIPQTSRMQKTIRKKMRCKRCSRRNRRDPSILPEVHACLRRYPRSGYVANSNSRCQAPVLNLVNFPHHRLPPVYSRLVAKLRRLGTSLIWEPDAADHEGLVTLAGNHKTSSKGKYDTRKKVNERNEVLIDFNQVLSEVFPLQHHNRNADLDGIVSKADAINHENEPGNYFIESLCDKLPQGITISLVNGTRHKNN